MAGASILAVNLLIPVSLLIFASGFFPYKAFLPGHSSFTNEEAELAQHAPFNKVIFMVVDALRTDFVYSHGSGFEFTQGLIRSGSAMPFTAHATAPTITLPRIKALTTGSIPSFLDVILNFAESDETSSLESQDTWLAQLKARRGGRLVLYGDDTWLKLFPHTFSRAEGTSSFFVSDFTEVDHNVTRNVPAELENNDWNGMILHYLGLDHIGHKTGPNSPYMVPKQAEMDDIVRDLYHALMNKAHLQRTLLVLCGDHGMNDAGNHGGSSEGETSPALVFISPKLRSISEGMDCPVTQPVGSFNYYEKVQQSDIAPTLAGLLGFPIPKNSLGIHIPSLLRLWAAGDRMRIVEQNAQQFLRLVNETFPSLSSSGHFSSETCSGFADNGMRLACLWSRVRSLDNGHLKFGDVQISALGKFLQHTQNVMSSAASNYSARKLYSGIAVATTSEIISLIISSQALLKKSNVRPWALLMTMAYGLMMFASSAVEEEHQYWYFLASAWFWRLGLKQYVGSTEARAPVTNDYQTQKPRGLWSAILAAAPLATMRAVRAWNQTGQKHAGESDIARGLLSNHNYVLWALVGITYIALSGKMLYKGPRGAGRTASVVYAVALCVVGFVFKVAFTLADAPELLKGLPIPRVLASADLTRLARVLFVGMLLNGTTAFYVFQRKARYTISDRDNDTQDKASRLQTGQESSIAHIVPLHGVLTLFLMTQSRVTNIPLFALFELQMQAVASMNLSVEEISLTSLVLQYTSFFAFGGSNSISSIDLSNGYNGVSGYNAAVVGALTFCSNWAGPIWWTFASILLLTQCQQDVSNRYKYFHHLSTCFITNGVLFVMLACTTLRTHLFIWTVFSPKFLYMVAWSFGIHLLLNTFLVRFLV